MQDQIITIDENGQVDARFLLWADFSGPIVRGQFRPNETDTSWIKGVDGEVDAMTYEEFRSHSRVLLASRPLPDGKVK